MRNILSYTSIAVLTLAFPIAAFADVSNTVTVSSGQHFSFDTGAAGSSGGDIVFTGTSITFVGAAGAVYLGPTAGLTTYNNYTQQTISFLPASSFTQTAITTTGLLPLGVNGVMIVHTVGGNYSKVLITSLSSTSITFQFDTFGASGGVSGPTITAIQNNYSYLLPGQPNYGIAPGTLFIVKGTGLASATTVSALQSSAAPGLPTNLNGATVSVTVNGVATNAPFYYAIATQLALVLPSATPAGTGTLTVNYNGGSASSSITVVPSALGLDSLYGTGTGLAVATSGATVFNYNNSVAPGQEIVLWGTGLGADTADSDTTFASSPHTVNVPLTVYVGGIQATVDYQASSGYPGVNQINITIPPGVQPGCAVSVVAVSGSNNAISNSVTLPVAATSGATCSDPVIGYNGSQFLNLGAKANYNQGGIFLSQTTSSSGVSNGAFANFYNTTGSQSGSGVGLASIGSCIVNAPTSATIPATFTTTPLDAGKLSVTGPTGTQSFTQISNPLTGALSGGYTAALPAGFIPSGGGSFTFAGNGGSTAGASVGAFSANLNFSTPVVWSNMSSITSVNRAQGVTVTWTGGAANTFVNIAGGSSSSSAGLTVSFTCVAPVAAGTFTVPSYILLALPAGSGNLGVAGETAIQTFAATGLDYGYLFGSSGGMNNSISYN